MTHHDPLDRELPAWLADDAARPVPRGLLDAIAAASQQRRQQPPWLVALRGDSMGATSNWETISFARPRFWAGPRNVIPKANFLCTDRLYWWS